jgi:hypothetical protein
MTAGDEFPMNFAEKVPNADYSPKCLEEEFSEVRQESSKSSLLRMRRVLPNAIITIWGH